MPPGRTLAIGDIHGCHRSLLALVEAARIGPRDEVIFLGDYTDRGPDSKSVIQWLMDQRSRLNLITLRGNHEIMMMEARHDPLAFHFWTTYGGAETMASYGAEEPADMPKVIPQAHWDFIEGTQPWLETDTHLFVHAGADPELEMKHQSDEALYWKRFENIQPHYSGKTIICGHTAQSSGQINDVGYAICIDTAACRGRWLTCLDVTSLNYWQAEESGGVRSGTLEPFARG